MAFVFGCKPQATASPVGLKKPPASDFAALQSQKFELRNIVATITLPKDNPSKSQIPRDSRARADFLRALPPVYCEITCTITPEENTEGRFAFGVGLKGSFQGHDRMAYGNGTGEFKRLENGVFSAESVELLQRRPIEMTDKITLDLRVIRYPKKTGGVVEVDAFDIDVIVKQAE